jgi:hypothetical protein
LEKHVKMDKEKQPMKTECNRPIEEREKGGQHGSPMVRGVQLYQTNWRVNRSDDGQPGDWLMDREKAVTEEICQKESTV